MTHDTIYAILFSLRKEASMKKLTSLCLCGALCATLFGGCSSTKNDPNTLNIVVYDGGYGSQWVYDVIEIFESENPGYTVNPIISKNAATIITTNMSKNNNTDDLYISVNIDWDIYAPQGKLASLDDLYSSEVDGVLFKDKVNDCYQNAVKATCRGEEHYYRTPWTAGVGGIFYNVKMFRENGWNVPKTYEELQSLCETISKANVPVEGSDEETVKPFVFTGGESYYWEYTIFNWWGQLAGKENIDDFLQYDSPSDFDYTNKEHGTAYSALKDSYSLWYDLIAKNNDKYCMNDCTAKTYTAAQGDFVSGKAAMMPNGQWLYNEMKDVAGDFEMALMPTPYAPGIDDNSPTAHTQYVVGQDQSIVIPASSTKQDLAKKFIQVIASNRGCEIFLRQANGILGFDYSFDESDPTLTTFQKSILSVQNGGNVLFNDYSNTLLGKSGQFEVIPVAEPYNLAITGYKSGDTQNSTNTPDKVFTTIKNYVASNWSIWLEKIS